MDRSPNSSWCSFVPNSFLSMIADDRDASAELREAARNTVDEGDALMAKAESSETLSEFEIHAMNRGFNGPPGTKRLIFDAKGDYTLPGTICFRYRRQIEARRIPVDWVYYTLGRIFDFFQEGFGYKLFENNGSAIHVTLNYGNGHMNAHWTGKQVILGIGNPLFLHDFYKAEDVIAHEITHGIIMRTSGLEYTGETGALFEHLADVFGILYKQRAFLDTLNAEHSPWIIGEKLWGNRGTLFGGTKTLDKNTMNAGLFYTLPCYLRSFADPESTKPPQPIHYDDYQNLSYDNGGVHHNSGILNYAFYTAAIAAGGPAWSGVGQVWFLAMIDTNLGVDCKFPRFAAFTMTCAKRDYPKLLDPIAKGWKTVGIEPDYTERN